MKRIDESREQKKRAGSRRGAEAAARGYIRLHLGWLRGFPVGQSGGEGLCWIPAPSLGSEASRQPLLVTRDLLRQTEYGRNAVKRKFPRALPQVVGDVDAWSARIDQRLELLKDAVHGGKATPPLAQLLELARFRRPAPRALRLASRIPALEPPVAGLVWVNWEDEAAFANCLSIMEEYAAPLATLAARFDPAEGLAIQQRLVDLLADGCGAGPLVELLADRRCWDVPLEDGDLNERLRKALSARWKDAAIAPYPLKGGFDRPKPTLAQELIELSARLASSSKTVRIRQMQLLSIAAPGQALADWERWWARIGPLERAALRLLRVWPLRLDRAQTEKAKDLRDELLALPAPQSFRWKELREPADIVCAQATPKAFAELAHCLRLLPEIDPKGKPVKKALLEEWSGAFADPARGWGVIESLLAAQRRLLEQTPEKRLAASCFWLARNLTWELIDFWITSARPRKLIAPVMEALGELINGQDWPGPFARYLGWESLAAAAEVTADAKSAAALIASQPPADPGLHGDAWAALLRLADGSPARFKAMAQGWVPEHWRSSGSVRELTAFAKAPELAELAVDCLMSGEGRRLSRMVAQTALARAMGIPDVNDGPEEAEAAPELVLSPYPAELHGLLRDLARVDPKANRAIEKMFAEDFPVAARMKDELAALRSMAPQAEGARRTTLEARMRKLERRLAATPEISPQRSANYRAKIQRRIRHFRLLRLEQTLLARLRDGLEKKFGAPVREDWFDREDVLRLLSSLAGLESGFRTLAFRLIGARCGPEPWDLRQEGANRAFLAELERRCVKIGPWLDGIGPRPATSPQGALALDLEKDPLEVMRMGEPFHTCLEPGSVNFFSAVANAADINKRVLYGRDRNGVIQARCLLALTEDGAIVAFRVYAHNHQDVLQEAVKAYALDLAQAMGTTVVPTGQIKTLLAGAWYDDGSIDLTGDGGLLGRNSPFVQSLPGLAVEDLIPRLEQSCGTITPYVAVALARLPVFYQRPELVIPLIPYVSEAALDEWTRLIVVRGLRMAGRMDAALRMFAPLLTARPDPEHQGLIVSIAEEMIALGQPHRALRLILQTRIEGIEEWEDEWRQRSYVAGCALEALHRPRKALTLHRVAARGGSPEAARRVEALENLLDR